MSANKTENSHVHRLRHRTRITPNSRKFVSYLTKQAARLNTVGTVTGVTTFEIEAAHRAAPWFVRSRYVREASTNAEVLALGIPVA